MTNIHNHIADASKMVLIGKNRSKRRFVDANKMILKNKDAFECPDKECDRDHRLSLSIFVANLNNDFHHDKMESLKMEF